MIGSEQAREIFRALALRENARPKLFQQASELPPYLCRLLAFDMPISDQADERAFALVGNRAAELLTLRFGQQSVEFCVDGFSPELLEVLPLAGHIPVSEIGRRQRFLEQAVVRLRESSTSRFKAFLAWTSVLLWLEADANAQDRSTLLTSSTLPALPFCTFITDKALRHIPPNNVSDADQEYALRENIYHESLHQQLTLTLLFEDILRPDYDAKTAERINVPWRGASWEPDRVLHAVYVYSNLIPMRRDELMSTNRSADDDWLKESIVEGREALSYLTDALSRHRRIFTKTGAALFEEVMEAATLSLNLQSA